MSREVRRVPSDWIHPKRENGSYKPLYNKDYKVEFSTWLERKQKWEQGLEYNYLKEEYFPISEEYKNMAFEDAEGKCPDSRNYMPSWPEELRTHYMMYETVSEGTPISPAFETLEELAKRLADNKASAFAGMTAT